jgi:hypothetical protein
MNKTKVAICASIVAGVVFSANSMPLNNVLAIKNPHQQIEQMSFDKEVKSHKNYLMMKKTIKRLMLRLGKTSYVFSGSDTRGWDCSGLVRWTYEQFGLDIPHSADKQGHIGRRVSEPALGDIVVFAYKGRKDFYHSAIYAGQNMVINANLMYGTTVLQTLGEYSGSQIRFVRLVDQIKTVDYFRRK